MVSDAQWMFDRDRAVYRLGKQTGRTFAWSQNEPINAASFVVWLWSPARESRLGEFHWLGVISGDYRERDSIDLIAGTFFLFDPATNDRIRTHSGGSLLQMQYSSSDDKWMSIGWEADDLYEWEDVAWESPKP